MMIAPLVSSLLASSRSSGLGGIRSPSYHVRSTGGLFPRAGNLKRMIEATGYESSVLLWENGTVAVTEVGLARSSAQKAGSRM